MIKSITDNTKKLYPYEPGKYLNAVNSELIDHMNNNFITAIYGLIRHNPVDDSFSFIYSIGAHPSPIIHYKATDEVELLYSAGTILGSFPDMEYEEASIPIHKGDRIYLYTDGIPETVDESNEIFGFDEMSTLIKECHMPTLNETLDSIITEVTAFSGASTFDDDIVIMGIEIL